MVAAALFGEGMSSPLMDEIRERRGLVYYASCSADVNELCGQFVVEASTSPAQLDEFLVEVRRLLAAQAEAIAPADLERARRQIAVRTLRAQERPVAPPRGRGARPVRAWARALARRAARARRGGRRRGGARACSRACSRRRWRWRSPAGSRRARASGRARSSLRRSPPRNLVRSQQRSHENGRTMVAPAVASSRITRVIDSGQRDGRRLDRIVEFAGDDAVEIPLTRTKTTIPRPRGARKPRRPFVRRQR